MIDWNSIPPHYKWVAKDESGFTYAYSHKPQKGKNGKYWVRQTCPRTGSSIGVAMVISRDDCMDDIPWEESLTARPLSSMENFFNL